MVEAGAEVGGTLLVGFEGEDVPEWLLRDLRTGRCAGVVVFRRNFSSLEALAELVARVRAVRPDAIVAADQEGGRVQRFREPFPELPPMAAFGAKRRKTLLGRAGALLAAGCRKLGVNLDFAPVLDVASRPDNPVIGDRALHGDPSVVARLGAAFIDGMQEAGVAACAKHFPGHGDTAQDSHVSLPVVDATRETMMQRELVPFRAAARIDVAAMMTAHVVYPSFDAQPATRSQAIIQSLLRDELRYEGVVVTDDIEMVGFGEDLGVGAVEAMRAGCDLMLVCRRRERVEEVREALVRGLERGALSPNRVSAAAARVAGLARAFPAQPYAASWEELREERDALLADIGDAEFALEADPTEVS